MFKLSKMTDYGLVLLSRISEEKDLISVSQLAEKTHLPEPTVAKLMRLLVKADIVRSVRGVQGGYSLKCNPEDISAEEVMKAIDGPLALTACVEESSETCALLDTCPLCGRWQKINEAVTSALQNITLKDLRT